MGDVLSSCEESLQNNDVYIRNMSFIVVNIQKCMYFSQMFKIMMVVSNLY